MPFNKRAAVEYLKRNAGSESGKSCAAAVRRAIEAGGITLTRTSDAKDYGTSLQVAGFTALTAAESPELGDVVVIQNTTNHPQGHMAMFDGQQWISDFVQSDLYPGKNYRKYKPSYIIYRHR